MEEILFENIYADTESIISEQYKKMYAPGLLLWSLVFGTTTLILLFFVFVLGDKHYWPVLLFSAAYLISLFFRHRIYSRRYMNNLRNFYNGTVPETIHRFTEDTIYSIFGTQTFHVPIVKVDKLQITAHLLILYVGKTHRMTLKKDSFTKGTYEEFLAFLRTRCPELKIPE